MKRLFNLLLVAALLVFPSCGGDDDPDDIIYDFSPYVLSIEIVDSAGRNLLDPAIEGNMTGEKVEMLYDGKRYPMNIAETPEVQSRYYAPRFFGLQLEKAYDFRTSKYLPWRLYWGEFDRAVNASYTFALQFADRDCQPLNFELKIKNDHHGGVEEILLVDGKTVDASAVYKVVLP